MASLASTSTTTGSGGSSLVAGASGGGDISTLPAVPADLATALAQAQQAIAALTAAMPSLTGGGALPTGEMPALAPGAQPEAPPAVTGGGAPGQTPGQTPAQHAQHGAGGKGEGKAGKKGKKGGHGVHSTERKGPEDPAKAQKYLDATVAHFKDFKRSDLKFNEGKNTHGRLSPKQRAEFEKKFPGLEAPTAVVFPKKGGNAPIGVVYSQAKEKDFDLGMGSTHKHKGSKNAMQHVWFTPQNLEFAFSDQSQGGAKKVQQMMQGGGAPQKK